PYRGGTLLARGYRFLRELHERDPVPFYTTVIYEGNLRALQSLSGARAGLPVYCDWGLLLTPALRLDFGKPPIRLPGVTLVRGEDAEVQRIVEFLNTWQSRKQFAPVYRLEDFGSGRFFGLRGRDFFLAVSDGRIIGTVAAWDQSAARQTHVERYSRGLELIRPFYNCAALFCALKPLPKPGARIPYVYLACMAAENNDAHLMRALLRYAYNALRIGQSHYAIAGLHERDPLAALLAEYRCVPAAGRLFVVHYAEQHERVAALAARVPYVEAGCL
ncbi:MAG: hypothetical protein ACXWCH_33305, partial [Burkholderiales bacterium]